MPWFNNEASTLPKSYSEELPLSKDGDQELLLPKNSDGESTLLRSDDEEPVFKDATMIRMNQRKKKILAAGVTIIASHFFWGLSYGLHPSFYPSKAEEKRARPSQYGFTFGASSLAAVIAAPLCGGYGHKVANPKTLYILGEFVTGITGIAFGFLDYVDDTWTFIVLSYVFRALEGMSFSVSATTGMAMLMKCFPGKSASVAAWTEGATAMGSIFGPVVGATLYGIGGFTLPFVVVCSWPPIMGLMGFFLIPPISQSDFDSEQGQTLKPLTFKKIVKSPEFVIPYLDIFTAACVCGVIDATLGPFLKHLGGSNWTVGTTFLFVGVNYAIWSFFAGHICTNHSRSLFASVLGNLLMIVSFVFLGPLPFLPIQQSLMRSCISAAATGGWYSLALVSAFSRISETMNRQGFDDSVSYSLSTGIYQSMFNLGEFAGPTFGGILVDAMGFVDSTVPFLCLLLLILTANTCSAMGHTKAGRS